jgi:hypothetical protein
VNEWMPDNPYWAMKKSGEHKPCINDSYETCEFCSHGDTWDDGAKAQIRKLVEWGDGPCPHWEGKHSGDPVTWPRRECDKCWVEFKKEAGL